MLTNIDRILTTHVGSLPRSESLLQLLVDKEQGKSVDKLRFEAQVPHDLAFVLQRQADARYPGNAAVMEPRDKNTVTRVGVACPNGHSQQ